MSFVRAPGGVPVAPPRPPPPPPPYATAGRGSSAPVATPLPAQQPHVTFDIPANSSVPASAASTFASRRPLSRTDSHVDAAPTKMTYVHSNAFETPGLKMGERPTALPPPRRLFFGGHSLAEAGGSVCFPTSLLFVWRLLIAGLAVGMLVYIVVRGDGNSRLNLLRLPSIVFLVFVAAALLTMACSGFYMTMYSSATPHVTAAAHISGSRGTGLANITTPLHQMVLCASLFLTPVYWAFLRASTPVTTAELALHGLPLVSFGLDLLFSGRLRYKFFYSVLASLLGALYFGLAWVFYANGGNPLHMYEALDHRDMSQGRAIAIYASISAWTLVASIIVYIASRALCCIRSFDEEDDGIVFHDKRLSKNSLSSLTEEDGTEPSSNGDPRFNDTHEPALDDENPRVESPAPPLRFPPEPTTERYQDLHDFPAYGSSQVPQAQVVHTESNPSSIGQSPSTRPESPYAMQQPSHPSKQSIGSNGTSADTSLFQPVQPAYPAYPVHVAEPTGSAGGSRRSNRRRRG